MFVHAVIVGNNRAGAEVGFAADLGITDVGEVVGFGAVADGGVLTSTKLPMCTVVGQFGLRTQTGVWADLVVFADFATFKMGEWGDFGVGTDFGVF